MNANLHTDMGYRTWSSLAVVFALFLATSGFGPATSAFGAEADDIARTSSGRPDLSGSYDAATLTPFQRPEEFGENLELTPEEASEIIEAARERVRHSRSPRASRAPS